MSRGEGASAALAHAGAVLSTDDWPMSSPKLVQFGPRNSENHLARVKGPLPKCRPTSEFVYFRQQQAYLLAVTNQCPCFNLSGAARKLVVLYYLVKISSSLGLE